MKRFFQNRVLINSLILWIFTMCMEFSIRYFLDANDNFAILRIVFSSYIISLIFAYIGHFLPKLGQRILNVFYVVGFGGYMFAEFGLYNYIGFFMGIGNASQGVKVQEFLRDFFSSYKPIHWIIIIPIVIFIVYYIFFDKKVFKNIKNRKRYPMIKKVYIEIFTISILLFMCTLYIKMVKNDKFQNDLQTESNYALWLYPENSNLTVNNFGVLIYGFADIKSFVFGVTEEDVAKYEKKVETEKNEKEKEEDKKESVDLKRHINDEAWIALNESTTNATHKSLNEYFMNRNITDKNDMTGIFKDKNLIIIMMESTNEISVMSEEYFPTLYKLYNEGISFRNNFSPRNCCSTGNNEFTALSSLFTINNTCTYNAYAGNKYYEGVFNVFNRAGYTTNAFHDYTQKFYQRARTLPNLGANKYYGVESLGINYSHNYTEANDGDMFRAAKDIYMNDEHFMAYFATVSPHQSYISSQTCSDMYYKKYRDLGYGSNLSRYLSKLQVLDEGLKELLTELEEDGKLDDTVIALFADHYPYGLSDSQINQYLTKQNSPYTVNRGSTKIKDIDRTPMIIYNSQIEPRVINDYTTIIDLLPTLLNMFDVNYDPRLYLGTDIFSPDHVSRAVFADGSWQNERGYYHAPNSKMNYIEGAENYSNEELRDINSEISQRQKKSASAIRSNYFNYLGKGLEKYSGNNDLE